jgi:hypothetical protein
MLRPRCKRGACSADVGRQLRRQVHTTVLALVCEHVLTAGVSCPPCLCNHEHGTVTMLHRTASQATPYIEDITACSTTSVSIYDLSNDADSCPDYVG